MRLRLSDPALGERLVSFLASVGLRAAVAAPGVVRLEGEVEEAELAVYLRVFAVLYPGGEGSVEEE